MAFIGNQPALAYTSFAVQHFTTAATTSYTLNYPVANENEIRLVINNVVQQPGSSYAYSASGTALTLTAATTTSDTMYAVFLGKAVQTVNPPDGSVGASQIANGSITLAKLSATGTASSSTYLRGDNSWQTAGGDNTPAFQVKRTSSQTISDVTETKIQFNVEDFDTDSAFDSTTNYRFTVPTGESGKYCIYYAVNVYDYPATIYQYQPMLRKNGNLVNESGSWDGTSSSPVASYGYSYNNQIILDLTAGDYLELFVYINTGDGGTGTVSSSSTNPSFFGGYKMIGI